MDFLYRTATLHICISKLTIIGSDNGLLPGRCQTIVWTNAGILWIPTSGTNFNEILSKIHTFSFKKMHLKISGKWQPFCLWLNKLTSIAVPLTQPSHNVLSNTILASLLQANQWLLSSGLHPGYHKNGSLVIKDMASISGHLKSHRYLCS